MNVTLTAQERKVIVGALRVDALACQIAKKPLEDAERLNLAVKIEDWKDEAIPEKRHASLVESSRRLLADHEEMLSLLREASEALEPFVGMDEPGWTHTGADVARAQDVLAKIAKALTS